MKRKLLTGILSLSLLLSLIPCAFAEKDGGAFTTVYIECPDAKTLVGKNYHAYSHLLMRYADDKTPIPLSAVYNDYIYATIPAENADRPLEYFVSEDMEFTDEPAWDEDNYSEDSYNFYIMELLSGKGVIKGNEKGEALPFDNVTRAEAVAMAMRFLGVDNMPDTDSGFSDVPEDSWYAAAVTKARKLGVVAGDDETHFAPQRNVSREEMVALAARCLWTSGLQKEHAASREALAENLEFSDAEKISDWALSAYDTMKTYGTAEYAEDENGEFRYIAEPQNAATRFFAAYVLLEGCDMLQTYPSQTAISFGFDKNMPKIDGSTSTYPFTEAVYRSLFLNGFSHSEKPKSHSKSHASYERLINGEVDMIFASVYPASDILELAKSKGVELELIPIAYDAMIFFTNADNSVDGLTKKQISEIYVNNKYSNWKSLGGGNALLYPYCRNNDSGSHAQMERYFLNGSEINEKIREENTSLAMSNILTEVMDSQTDEPVGYGLGYSIYYYFQNMDLFYDTNRYLKLLKIDGVYPDDDTIASGEYPLSNNTYAVLRKDEPENSPARKMAEFMLTKEGQMCVEEAGFGPINPPFPKEFTVTKKTHNFDIMANDNETALLSVTASYPSLNNKNNRKFVNNLNKEFKELAESFEEEVEGYREDISEYYSESGNYDMLPFDNYLTYDVTRNYGDIFSVTFDAEFYLGGVHPNTVRASYTYNTKEEKELTLPEILGKTQDETDKFVIEKFYEEYEAEDLWDLEDEAYDVSFLIEGEDLILYFQQYQIASYAMGFPEVRIPLDTLK